IFKNARNQVKLYATSIILWKNKLAESASLNHIMAARTECVTPADEFDSKDHYCWVISHVPSCWTYSARSATIGSTLAARAAGIQDARSAAAQSNNVAMVSIRGSHGETPKS